MEPMVRKTVPVGGKKYVYYVCSGNKKDKTSCSPHRIAEADLTDSVLYLLQTHIENVLTLEAAMQVIEKAPKLKADVAKFDERIVRKRAELEKAEKRKLNLYEDLKDGIISKKEYLHYHKVLEAEIVLSNSVVLSLDTEFIEGEQENISKQDCEQNVGKRILNRIKKEYPRLTICIQGDALYATEPIMKICRENNWMYIFTQKGTRQRLLEENYKLLEEGKDKIVVENVCIEKGEWKIC